MAEHHIFIFNRVYRTAIIFFMSTPATEIEHVCGRFEVIKDRARVMVRSLLEEQELDLVAIQNANCPDDPLVADFFNE